MAITRDSRHKRRNTGGRRNVHKKKRKFEVGRQAANTKLNAAGKRIHIVRARGGAQKFRALRLDTGNFSWGSEVCTRKTRILDVVYNASNNELVRTKTLVKNCIVQVDATPFKQWYETHFGVTVGPKGAAGKVTPVEATGSDHHKRKYATRQRTRELDARIREQLAGGRILAAISSRPGQSGRADGYVLEGAELAFYMKEMNKKKKGRKA
uniref:40S ribosomal protein S8 n=1 Tax=Bicosoecida sp. CB-2014 TaxID=1486930 RepID=A0A7S1CDM3_9STRA